MSDRENALPIRCKKTGRVLGLQDKDNLYYWCKDHDCRTWSPLPLKEIVQSYLTMGGSLETLIQQITVE